jgi:hypothetical protein
MVFNMAISQKYRVRCSSFCLPYDHAANFRLPTPGALVHMANTLPASGISASASGDDPIRADVK